MFNTVVVDPPWPISMSGKFKSRRNRPEILPYNTMSLAEIQSLDIKPIVALGGHVYLWATNKTLRDAFDVLEAWGIRYHMTLVMAKPSGMTPSMGYVFGTEFCLLGINDRPMQKFKSVGTLNWFTNPPRRGEHSKKPDTFYEMVEKMSPGPYADVFARQSREGWSVWGNEVVSDFNLFAP